MTFRDAADKDVAVVVEATLAAYAEYASALPDPFWPTYRESIVETVERDPRPERIVAEQAGAIVGSVLLYPTDTPVHSGVAGGLPEIRLLAVLPAARGRGIGSALVRECIRRATAAGAPAISLHTTDWMPAAMALYEGMGFTRTPETDFQPAKGINVKGYRLLIS